MCMLSFHKLLCKRPTSDSLCGCAAYSKRQAGLPRRTGLAPPRGAPAYTSAYAGLRRTSRSGGQARSLYRRRES